MIDPRGWLLVLGLSVVAVAEEPIDAIGRYRDLVASNPNDAELWTELGIALASGGHAADAISAFRSAIDRSPDEERARIGLAPLLAQAGHYDEAREQVQAVLLQNPTQGQMIGLRGWLAGRQGDLVAAERDTRAAIFHGSVEPELRLQLARILELRAKYDAAADEYRRYRDIEPGSTAGHLGGARIAVRAGDYGLATRLLSEARERGSDPALISGLEVDALLRSGQGWAAVRAVRDWKGLPGPRASDLVLAFRVAAALDSARVAAHHSTGSPDLHSLLDLVSGDIESAQRRPADGTGMRDYLAHMRGEDMILAYRARLDRSSADIDALLGLAVFHALRGDRLEALGLSATLRARDPAGDWESFVRGLLAATRGDRSGTQVHLERWAGAGLAMPGRNTLEGPHQDPLLLALQVRQGLWAQMDAREDLAEAFLAKGHLAAASRLLEGLSPPSRGADLRVEIALRRREFGLALSEITQAGSENVDRRMHARALISAGRPDEAISILGGVSADQDPILAAERARACAAAGLLSEALRRVDDLAGVALLEVDLARAEVWRAAGRNEDALELLRSYPTSIEALVLRSDLILAMGLPRRAGELAEEALRSSPDDVGAVLALARAYAGTGERDRAIDAYRQSVGLGSSAWDIHREFAHYLGEGSPAAVRSLLAGRQAPATFEDRLLLAEVHVALGDTVSAIDEWMGCLREIPHHEKVTLRMAQTLVTVGRREDAMDMLRRTWEGGGRSWKVALALAEICRDLGARESAMAAFSDAVAASPDTSSAHVASISFLVDEGRWDDALSLARVAFRTWPGDVAIQRWLLRCADRLGHDAQAVSIAKTLFETRPLDQESPFWRAWISFGEGRWVDAQADLVHCRKMDIRWIGGLARRVHEALLAAYAPSSPESLDEVDQLLRNVTSTVDEATALELLEHGIARHPGEPRLLVPYARILVAQGKAREAIEKLDPALEAPGTRPEALGVLGAAYAEIGDYLASAVSYESAMEEGNEEAEIWFRLGLIYVLLERRVEAAEALALFVEEAPESAHASEAMELYLRLGGR